MDRPTRFALWVGVAMALVWPLSFAFGFRNILAVLSLAGFVLAVIGIRRPTLGLIAIGILCSLDSLMRSYLMKGGWLRYNTFNYLLLIVIFLSIPLLKKQNNLQVRLLLTLFGLLFLEMAMTPSMEAGILHLLNMTSVFGLMVYFLRTRMNPNIWYALGMSVGFFSAITGFAFFFNNEQLTFSVVDERAFLDPDYRDPNYIDANALGYAFITGVFSLCLALSSMRHLGRRSLVPILSLMGINFCWILLVGSRGSMLVGSACVIFTLIELRSNSRRFKFAAVLLVGALFVLNVFPDLIDRSVHRVDKLMDSKYSAAQRTSARSDLAIGAWRIFLKHPLGAGTGGYQRSWADLDVHDLRSSQGGHEKGAHSAWLKILAENGIPGIIVFSVFVGSYAFVGMKFRRYGLMPIGILVTLAIGCAFVSTEFQSKGIWFMVAGATVFMNYQTSSRPQLRGGYSGTTVMNSQLIPSAGFRR